MPTCFSPVWRKKGWHTLYVVCNFLQKCFQATQRGNCRERSSMVPGLELPHTVWKSPDKASQQSNDKLFVLHIIKYLLRDIYLSLTLSITSFLKKNKQTNCRTKKKNQKWQCSGLWIDRKTLTLSHCRAVILRNTEYLAECTPVHSHQGILLWNTKC